MSGDLLDLHLKILVLEHGRSRVVQSLARIGDVSEASVEAQLAAARNKVPKSAKVSLSAEQILSRMVLEPSKRERVASLAREFENKRFLGELRLVKKFLREHHVGTVPKSRSSALPKVVAVLAILTERELDELLADCSRESSETEYSQLAGAIMGKINPRGPVDK